MQKQVEEQVGEEFKLPVCEATLMPVTDEYTYIHHNFIEVGVLKYIEKAP